MAREFVPYVPTTSGQAALAELDRVKWGELAHAYGRGVSGPGVHEDVRATLQLLAGDDVVVPTGIYNLYSNVCHQGTIYEATAHAVPFLAAFVAGDVWQGWARQIAVLLGEIAIASSFETEDGTSSGSFGENVGEDTRAAFRASAHWLAAIADRWPTLADLVRAIDACVHAGPPTRKHLDAIAACVQLLETVDDGDPPRPTTPMPEEWVSHPKFGTGLVVRRVDDKTCVRFADGSEKTIANRFLSAAEKP